VFFFFYERICLKEKLEENPHQTRVYHMFETTKRRNMHNDFIRSSKMATN